MVIRNCLIALRSGNIIGDNKLSIFEIMILMYLKGGYKGTKYNDKMTFNIVRKDVARVQMVTYNNINENPITEGGIL